MQMTQNEYIIDKKFENHMCGPVIATVQLQSNLFYVVLAMYTSTFDL